MSETNNDSLIQAITILIQNPGLVDVVLDKYTDPNQPAKVEEYKTVKRVVKLSPAKKLRNKRILMAHSMGLKNVDIQKLIGVSWGTVNSVVKGKAA